MANVIWKNIGCSTEEARAFSEETGVPLAIATILVSRGVAPSGYESFVNPRLSSLSDPFELPGVEVAAERIWRAVSKREKIVVFGDYDTDGVTSAALVAGVLRDNGADVAAFLPHRFDDGYGFTVEVFEKMRAEHSPDLVVTVDCGMDGAATIEVARSAGVDVVLTDHHEPGSETPKASALVNPQYDSGEMDFSALSGVGVAFKVCHGFLKYGRGKGLGGFSTDLRRTLDLVALGTVADVMPLVGENRAMVSAGLRILTSQTRPGVRALCESAAIDDDLSPSHISFKLAPKLNAAGRIGDPEDALRLLSTGSIVEAHRIAKILEGYNVQRRTIENTVYAEALEALSPKFGFVSPVAREGWHQGVLGIVASRLVEEFNRAAVVLTIENGVARGSARSVAGVDMVDVLSGLSSLLMRFGGHSMAAGVKLDASDVPEFFERLDEAIGERMALREPKAVIEYCGEMEVSRLDEEFFSHLKKLEPFGCGNPEPVFKFNRLSPLWVKSAAGKHSRGELGASSGASMGFIAFGRSVSELPSESSWDVLAIPKINRFQGREMAQLQMVDVLPSA